MDNKILNKCPNCGAGVERADNHTFKCTYCGSKFNLDTKTDDAYRPQPQPGYISETEAKKQYMDSLNRGGPSVEELRKRRSRAAGKFVLIVISFMVVVNYLTKNTDDHSSTTSSSGADTSARSTKNDTSSHDSTITNSPNVAIIKLLSSIDVDKATFKDLYKAARIKHDQFSGSTYIYDKSSPQYVNYNAIYTHIDRTSAGSSLRFSIQYTADEWLFIKSVTFNADGQNFDYQPIFKTDNGKGAIWEWSDQGLDNSQLPMLIKIATSKKVQAKYNGDKYYKIVTVTALQKAAIKKELQIYKGLLLGYDK